MDEMEQFNHKRTFAVAGVGLLLLIVIVGVMISAFFRSEDGKGSSNGNDSNAIIVSNIEQGEQQADTLSQAGQQAQYAASQSQDYAANASNDDPAFAAQQESSAASSGFGGVAATPAPTYYAPAQAAGEGCYFAAAFGGNVGLRVARGSDLPPSSLFEPDFSSTDLHHFRYGGIAPESGVVWMFVDDQGMPASDACIFAQLHYFSGRNFIQH